MSRYVPVLIFIFFAFSCKTQDKATSSNQSVDADVLFSLKSTSCMGECPVYELKIMRDSTIHFIGVKFTTIEGAASKKLSSDEYTRIIAMINEVGWSKLEDKYESNMSDLPSFNFVYKDKRVYQYGQEPKSLSKLRKDLLPIIDYKDFF
jgi:hypothetical protein